MEIIMFQDGVVLMGRSSKAFWPLSVELHLEYMSMSPLARKGLKESAVLIRCECRALPSFRFLVLMHLEMNDAY